jgi:glutamine amidotransferase
MISVLDYGLGNIGSILNIVEKCGYQAIRTNNSREILNSSHLIIPGVGSFDQGINILHKLDLL